MEKDWDAHAETNPYWAVVTWDKFKGDLEKDPALLDEFFQIGRNHIDALFDIISASLCADFSPKRALDFGCGVGRLLLPLAERGLEVSGVDISDAMLSLTKKHLASHGFEPVALVQSLDALAEDEQYDFVHTFITLQHVPVKLGLSIIDKLMSRVAESGILVFHVTYFGDGESVCRRAIAGLINLLKFVVLRVGVLRALYRLLRGRDMVPVILMGNYPLNRIFSMLSDAGFNSVHVRHSEHGYKGVVVLAQRSQSVPHPEAF